MKLENSKIAEQIPETKEGTNAFLSENQRKDRGLLRDIAIQNPERLSYDKFLSGLSDSMVDMKVIIFGNVSALKYAPGNMKNDTTFLNQLIEDFPGSKDTIKTEVLKDCNVVIDLTTGKVMSDQAAISRQQELYNIAKTSFSVQEPYNNSQKTMSNLIAKDASMILLASESLRDNKDFVKTECYKNDQVIETIVDNFERFGTNGVIGAQEANRDKGENECVKKLEENLKQMTEILRAKGLTDEQIQQDVIITGIRNELSKLKGISVMQDGQREQSLDSYFQDMAQSGDEDIIPEDIFHRASNQDKICKELGRRKEAEKESTQEDIMEL